MKIIIVGCGQMGSELATELSLNMHDVTVIDKEQSALALLPSEFIGKKIAGTSFDQKILEDAGIKSANALITCSQSDTLNALVSHIARAYYHVPFVLARLYDTRKAKTYRTLGVETISTTKYGVERTMELLEQTKSELEEVYTLEDGAKMIRAALPDHLIGKRMQELNSNGEIELMAVERKGKTIFPQGLAEFQHGDVLYLAVTEHAVKKLKILLGIL